MGRERQAILSLIALGRITPREAERLLAAWNSGREELLILGTCAVGGLAYLLAEVAQNVLPVHDAVAAILRWVAGV